MLKYLLQVSVVVLVFGQVAILRAQVLSPPASQPKVGVQQAGGPAAVAQTGTVEQTGWGIPMPKLTMPKITMPKLTMPQMTMPSMGAVTGPFQSGFEKVSSGSKKAWEGTKEMFSFGSKKTTASARRARSQQKTSFWQRLLTQPEPQGPQTVGEFMSQPRLNP